MTWYHGTAGEFDPGDYIDPGHAPNWDISRTGRVYFTGDVVWASIYAIRAAYPDPAACRVYEVRPVAKRTFRDANRFCRLDGLPDDLRDGQSRWSCKPLMVIREVPFGWREVCQAVEAMLSGARNGDPPEGRSPLTLTSAAAKQAEVVSNIAGKR